MAAELEQAILSAAAGDASAAALCAVAGRASAPPSLVALLHSSPYPAVQFWCLQSLHESLSSSASSAGELRSSLISLALPPSPLLSPSSPSYLRNKLAQSLASLIRQEYPSRWPSAFSDLLPPAPPTPHAADMFSRVLVALDDDLLSPEYPRSPADNADAVRLKDAMRAQGVPHVLARHWLEVVNSGNADAAAAALDTARRYIPWIDVGIVANDTFLPMLFNLAGSPSSPSSLRSAAAASLRAVVAKRMDPRPKLALLQSFLLNQRVLVRADPSVILCLAPLITGYAAEALECYKRFGKEDADGAVALELLEETLPSVFYIMDNSDDDTLSGDVLEFLSGYVSAMKSPSEKQLLLLGSLLHVIRTQMMYDPAYRANLDVLDKVGKEEEDEMTEHRKELLVLFRSIARAAPQSTQLFIRDLLVSALSSESCVEDVEVSLTLFHRLAETISEDEIRTGARMLGQLIPMLLVARFACHWHRAVALIYLDTAARYIKFMLENQQYIPHLLTAFLDDRGIHHANIFVRRRAGYLFMRAVKLLKSRLIPYLDNILQSLQDTVAQFTNVDWRNKDLKFSGSDDGSQVFEAIGLLISMDDVPPEKQSQCLVALLKPLCQQIESVLVDAKLQGLGESPDRSLLLQQIVVALNALSKGFNERLVTGSRPAVGLMFRQTLDVVIQVLLLFPDIKSLRSKITSFLHRMVELLGSSIFPSLPVALKQLLSENEVKDMVDFLVLINQMICKFSTSISGMLENIFPDVASRLFMMISRDVISNGAGGNTEEIRELQELQRTMFTFLHVITTHDLSSVFLAPNSRQYLDTIMQLVLYNSSNHKDMQVRKACVQIFTKLIKDWCGGNSHEDKLPGFRGFVIEKFATDCCLNSVLDKSFDLRDANALILLGEIVAAQKVLYEKLGEDFAVHFISKGLSAAHCPPDLAEQYFQKLQGGDIKALKSFYQSLIEKLRHQQNGTLVFR